MEFKKKENKVLKIADTNEELRKQYPTTLTMYMEPPTDSISLKEFEEMAVSRLTLLRAIERVNLTSHNKYSDAWKLAVQNELIKLNLNQYLAVATDGSFGLTSEEKKNNRGEALHMCQKYDYISHFVLRLAYCRSEDLSKWFITMELDLFRYKFMGANPDKRNIFLGLNGLRFDQADKAKAQEVHRKFIDYSSRPEVNDRLTIVPIMSSVDYYLVPFQHVLDLVHARRVVLEKGVAYVPFRELTVVVVTYFRKSLSHSVAMTKKLLPEIQTDERLCRILQDFDKRYTGKNYDTKKGNKENCITLEDLPAKAANSFPLCMKELVDVVEKEHHLKHFGRVQLGLFLKGIGLPIEDATNFWRSNFCKKAGMDGGRFDKMYLYNIRHMYGKEGKRADYTPYSCIKIINSAVGAGDHHGCPFRHSDATPLRSRLLAAKIPEAGIREILNLVQEKHYQIACQKYFEHTHASSTVDGGIQHPNQYFDESENANLGHNRKTRVVVPSTRVNVYAATKSDGSASDILQSDDAVTAEDLEGDMDME